MVIKDLLLRDIRESYFDMLKQVYKNCSWPIEAADVAIKVNSSFSILKWSF